MKKVILFGIAVMIAVNCFSQAPNWMWAKGAVGTNSNEGTSIAVDASGNSYVVGFFAGTSINFGGIILNNAGSFDMFIVKYDASGNIVWANSAGGNSADAAYSIAVDATGNCFVIGNFSSTSITFGTTTLTNTGTTSTADLFIVKYDTNGNMVWANSAGGSSNEYGNAIAVDTNGNCYVTGYFGSASINFGVTTLNNSGGNDVFIVKYDVNGNAVWANSAGGGGVNGDAGSGVAVDANGNCFVTGYFSSNSITFGAITLNNVTTTSTDIFIVKYDTNGNAIWANSAGGSNSDYGRGIAVDTSGNSYITGYYLSSSINFGGIILNNAGIDNMFVAKYSPNGTVVWANSAGGSSYDDAYSISVDKSGNSYVTGRFGSTSITFGTIVLINTTAGYSIITVKHDSNGNAVWANFVAHGMGFGNALDASRNCYVTGGAMGNTTFGTTTLIGANMFIAKLDHDCFAYYTTTYDSISNNFTLTVDAITSAMATGYHWDFGDGTTSTLVNPSHVYTVDTVYNVCMKVYTASGDSCEYCHIIGKDYLGNIYRTAGFTINVINNTTVNTPNIIKDNSEINISPNPFTSQTTITFSEEQKNTTLKVMNVLGECIQQLTTNNQQLTLDMSGLAKGVYFLSVNSQQGVVNRKIVKE